MIENKEAIVRESSVRRAINDDVGVKEGDNE